MGGGNRMPMGLDSGLRGCLGRQLGRATVQGVHSACPCQPVGAWPGAVAGKATMRIRSSLVASACLVGAALFGLAGPAAAAAPPQHVTFPLADSGSFDDCGFVVDFVQTGTIHVTLWRNDAGLVFRELDTASSFHLTFTREDTGKTISMVLSQSSQWDYGSGAVLGSSVRVTFVGNAFRLPGVGPDAGRIVVTGTVGDFTPEGVPLVAIPDQDPLFLAGRHPDEDLCAALS